MHQRTKAKDYERCDSEPRDKMLSPSKIKESKDTLRESRTREFGEDE